MTAISLIAAVLTGGLIGQILNWIVNLKSAKTDNWAKLAEAYSRQIADMAKSYGELDARVERLEAENEEERRYKQVAFGHIREVHAQDTRGVLPPIPEPIRPFI